MASSTKEDEEKKVFKPIKPHFFKIILPQTLTAGKLVIPKKFVKNYGNDLIDSVLLKVPNGDEWRVEMFRNCDDVYLTNGWQEFVKHYSLAHGHFLVFEYTSKCSFNVLLFDMSATEVDYPILEKPNHDEKSKDKGKKVVVDDDLDDLVITLDDSDDDDVEIISDDSDASTQCKRKRSNGDLEIARTPKAQRSVFIDDIKPGEMRTKRSGTFADNKDMSSEERKLHKVTKMTRSSTKDERAKAFERAKATFKPESPYFMVVIQPSYISRMRIPFQFAERYFREMAGKVFLQMLGGGTWIVSFSILYAHRDAYFKSNWKEFARDNNLKVGDVCIFALIRGAKLAFKVSISRRAEIANSSSTSPALGRGTSNMEKPECLEVKGGHSDEDQQSKAKVCTRMKDTDNPSGSKTNKVVASANAYSLENPHFKVVIGTWNIKRRSVVIPASFINNHVKDTTINSANLRVAERLWSVKVHVHSHGRSEFIGHGWDKFASDNDIRSGDVCKFELIQNNPLLLHVSIVKHVTVGKRLVV